ncbi:MAG: carbohydrate kinase family protein [Chloroflexi bacterium]|nr:MAG: carbohydrate kinase family protein [Chloroflexota bacterium]
MAKFLKDLLATDHPLFTYNLQQLEKATGNAGVDVRLIADVTEKAHAVMRRLKLDTADTTGEELYWALVSTVRMGKVEEYLGDTHFILASFPDGPVSFNIQDVVENAHHSLGFADRVVGHGQRHLRAEIIRRYAEHDRTRNEMVHELVSQAGLTPESDEGHRDIVTGHADKAPLILSIGDIVTDAFVKLRDDQAEVYVDEKGVKRISMEFGSKLPYERVDIVQAVGNSANAAVSFSRLGLRSGLMAFIGDDQAGKDSLTYLASEKVLTDTVSVQKLASNYHYALRYQAERTILIKYEDYDYVWQRPVSKPDWLYLSMLSASSWQLHEDMLAYLDEFPDVKLAFQPGTFHFEWGVDKLKDVYARSEIVFMNKEEAALVTGNPVDDIAALIDALHELGPKIVVVTDGPAGAYASDGNQKFVMPNYPDPAPPNDRTGAGDAFSSTITAALALGEPLQTALAWAPINSMSVVQQLGAQAGLLDAERLQQYLNDAPTDYKIGEL